MNKWNRPIPFCWQLILTQAVHGKPIPTGLDISYGYESTKPGFIPEELYVPSMICPFGNTRLTRSIQMSSRPEIGQLYLMFWPSPPSSLVVSAM